MKKPMSGGYGPTRRETSGIAIEKKSASQKVGKAEGKSSPYYSPIGSGARPVRSSYVIDSSAPSQTQMIRPSNPVERMK